MDELLEDLHALLKKHNATITVNNNELLLNANYSWLSLKSLSRTVIIDYLKEDQKRVERGNK